MVLGYIQNAIAEIIGIEKPKDIGTDFSFIEDKRLGENEFFALLEELEEEMDVDLVDCAWKFETVKQLVDYIEKKR